MNRIPSIAKAACVAAVLCFSGSAFAEANPEYASWAKCKPGATVKIEGNTEAMGQKTGTTVTTKLIEVTPEKAVVESTISINVMGQTMAQPAQKRDIPAEVKHADAGTPAAKAEEMLKKAKKGEDTVTVNGKSYKCTTLEVTHEENGIKSVSKTWNSPEVPGSLVKSEVNTSGAMASKTTMELKEFSDGK